MESLARETADRLERDYSEILGPKTQPESKLNINDWLPYNLDVKRVSENNFGETTFELTYPETTDLLPTMPLGLPTVMVALEQPVPLQQIGLSGRGLRSARVWVSTYDSAERFDTQDLVELGPQQHRTEVWNLPEYLAEREVSLMLIQADVHVDHRQLTLKLHRQPRMPE